MSDIRPRYGLVTCTEIFPICMSNGSTFTVYVPPTVRVAALRLKLRLLEVAYQRG